jgi:hypothetical protein
MEIPGGFFVTAPLLRDDSKIVIYQRELGAMLKRFFEHFFRRVQVSCLQCFDATCKPFFLWRSHSFLGPSPGIREWT